MACHNNTDKDYQAAMAKEHAHDMVTSNELSLGAPKQSVKSEQVEIVATDSAVQAYLAEPASPPSSIQGAIVMIHEWWGLNEHITSMARQLAGEGYAVLAVDLYQGKIATDVGTAQQYLGECLARKQACFDELQHGIAYLRQRYGNNVRIGTLGWCLGGMFSLQTAIRGNVDACVLYYGYMETDENVLQQMPASTRLLGIFGRSDQGVTVQAVHDFEALLERTGQRSQITIHIYDGADHAFANPTGKAFQKEPAMDAWSKTLDFFKQNLQTS